MGEKRVKMRMQTMVVLLAVATLIGLSCPTAVASSTNVIDCTVTLEDAQTALSIELVGATAWPVGTLALGGVADTWYNDYGEAVNGPGAFKVKNLGALATLRVFAAYSGTLSPKPSLPPSSQYVLACAANPNGPAPDWKFCSVNTPDGLYATLAQEVYTGDIVEFDLKFWAPITGAIGERNFVVHVVAMEPE